MTEGEEIVIRRGRRPVAKLVGYTSRGQRRVPGDLAGQIWMSEDFNEPDEEIERLFGMRDRPRSCSMYRHGYTDFAKQQPHPPGHTQDT